MSKFNTGLGFALALLCAIPSVVLADVSDGITTEGRYVTRPSILQYGWQGFSTGAAGGLAVGYLATGSHFQDDDWKPLIYGLGIGGLAGIGVGLSLGVLDASQNPDIPGAIVLRDMGYGASLGALGGLVTGALFAIDSGHGRDVLVGGAVGTITGIGVGMLIGIIDAAASASPEAMTVGSNSDTRQATEPQLRFSVSALPDRDGKLVWMPTAYGRF